MHKSDRSALVLFQLQTVIESVLSDFRLLLRSNWNLGPVNHERHCRDLRFGRIKCVILCQ